MGYLRRAVLLFDTYLLAPATGRLSTARFWYSPAPPIVVDATTLAAYHAQRPSPRYLIDYRQRTSWPLVGADGIVQLPYPAPIGTQYNPEAAFQTALGWHDLYRLDGRPEALEHFLHYARTYLAQQSVDGDFPYRFDYFEFRTPWSSALAQSRGASVMLRAFLLTGEKAFADSARAALSKFDVPSSDGGYRHDIAPGLPIYEEYPRHGHYTMNGFMVALMGCYEIAHWLEDERAGSLWTLGCRTLASEGHRFFTSWWTLYDLDRRGGMGNVNSPFYHQMICGYLAILDTLGAGSEIATLRARAQALDRWPNRTCAIVQKAVRKIVFR